MTYRGKPILIEKTFQSFLRHTLYIQESIYFTQKENKTKDCQIGVVDISDNSASHLNVNLHESEKHAWDTELSASSWTNEN